MRQYYFNLFFLFSIVCTANKLSGQNEIEPNNNFQTASRISVNSITSGGITNGSDNDVYSFEITSPGAILFNLRLSLPPGVSIQLQLYSANQTSIDYGYVDNNGGIFKELVCEKGVYYLVLSTFYGSPINVPYKLETTLDLEDSYECNNKIDDAKLINVNNTIKAKLLDAGDQDYYAIRVKQPGVLSFNTQISLAKGTSITTQLYSPDKLPIENGGEYLTKIVCDTGIYYFLIYTFSGSPDNTIYSLESTLFVDDKYECNNNSDAAALIPLCDTITATMYDENDYDYFNFRAKNGDSLTFKFLELSTEQEFSVDIFNQKSFFTSAGGNKGEKFELKFVSRDTNLFTIRIKSNQPSLTPYKFIVSNQACKENQVSPILAIRHIHVLPQNPLFSKERVLENIQSNESESKFFQVCADGSDASIFEVSIVDARDYDLSTLGVRIAEDKNNQNPSFYGNFSVLKTEKKLIRIGYTHPNYYGTEDLNLFKIFNLELFNKNSSKIISTFKLRVFRAPILTVHGLWGNDESFNLIHDFLDFFGKYKPQFILEASYQPTNHRGIYTNINVLPNHINLLFSSILDNEISVGKVNVLAHSMGGLVSRVYIQSTKYKGDILKLITLNTPHSGSQFADLLYDENFRSQYPEKFKLVSAEFDKIAENQNAVNGGAVNDLRVTSEALNELNKASNLSDNVALHSIISDNNDAFSITKIKIEYLLPFKINSVFNNMKNDVIVELTSQRGGLPMDAVTTYQNIDHEGIRENIDVFERINILFDSDPKEKLFAQKYNPVKLQYNSPFKIEEEVFIHGVKFLEPENGKVFNYGEKIILQVEPLEKIEEYLLEWGSPTPGIFAKKSGAIMVKSGKYQQEILLDSKKLGAYHFSAVGHRGGKFFSDSVVIYVTTKDKPTEIKITFPIFDLHTVSLGVPCPISVEAILNQEKLYIESAPGIEYKFKNGYAQYVGDGKILGIKEGIDEMIAIFNGVESPPVKIRIVKDELTTSLKEQPKDVSHLKVFPTITSDNVFFEFDSKARLKPQLVIFDLFGRGVFSKTFDFNEGMNLHSIPVSNLPKGAYLMTLFHEGLRISQTSRFFRN